MRSLRYRLVPNATKLGAGDCFLPGEFVGLLHQAAFEGDVDFLRAFADARTGPALLGRVASLVDTGGG
jgi:hypothetical protein